MPTLSIDIEARYAQAIDAVNQLTREFEKGAKKWQSSANLMKASLAGIGVGVSFKAILDAGVAAERSVNRLNATLKATGMTAGVTSIEIEKLVQTLTDTTAFDDEGIREAATTLLRFRDVQGDVYKQALRLSADLAAVQGIDVASAAQLVGRALETQGDSMKGLLGVTARLTQQQKLMIRQMEETGDIAGAQKIKLDALTQSIGGTAAAENKGLFGATKSVSKAWDDMLEAIAKSPAFYRPVVAAFNAIAAAARLAGDAIDDLASGFAKSNDVIDSALGTGRFAGLKPGQEPGDVDPEKAAAKAGAARQRLEQQREAARLAAERRAKINASTAKAGFDAEMKAAEQSSDVIQKVLDDSYEKGLITTRAYYDARVRLAESAGQREIEATNRLIKEQTIHPEDTTEERATKAAEVIKLEAQRARIAQKTAADIQVLDQKRTDDAQKYIDLQNETQARLLEGEGKLAQAALLRFGIEARALRIAQQQGEGDDAAIVTLRRRIEAQGKFNEALARTQDIYGELSRTERDIQNQREMGEITTQEALRRTDAARREQLQTLEREAVLLEQEAARTQDPRVVEQAKEARQAIEDLRAHSEQEAKQMREIFQDSMIDPFIELVNHTKTADEALKAFFQNVAQSLLRLEAQNIAERIFGGRAGGGGVGLIGGFFGLFGGSGTKIGTVSAKGNVMTDQGPLKLERYARGGIARRPMVSIFGEGSMPEAYVPLPDGRAIPVQMRGQEGGRLMAGPSAVMQRQPTVSTNVTLQLHPNAMHLTLRDWFEGEMSRQMATR